MNLPVMFFIDSTTILRVFIAVLWGTIWALLLQHTRQGQFLAEQRTWLTVVIGIGVDMMIAYAADWWTVSLVLFASSVPVIARSLLNESRETEALGRNRTKWMFEDAIALSNNLIQLLTEALDTERKRALAVVLSKSLCHAHRLSLLLQEGQHGRYDQHRGSL